MLNDLKNAVNELCDAAGLTAGDVMVVGCSTSEVDGGKIGKASNPNLGVELFQTIYKELSARGIFLAAQCCEHLNRAIIVERSVAVERGLEMVNVVPQPKAGGSFATAAYAGLREPVAVEFIKADAGLDIGDTLIGMHLKHVAVPVRLSVKKIGCANLVAARCRLKFIGGVRAMYN